MSKEPAIVASDRVADILADRIQSGLLKPGERIKQDQLAAELSISRIPIRDALRMLHTRGLVTLKPNSGAWVRALTVSDMEQSYRIREFLEPMLLEDSIPNLTGADIEKLKTTRERLDAVTDVDEYIPLSREFHWTAFSGHRSDLLVEIVDRLWDTTHSYRRFYAKLSLQDAARMETMRRERELLFGAIERREVDLAPRMLALHIRRTHIALLEYGDLHPTMME